MQAQISLLAEAALLPTLRVGPRPVPKLRARPDARKRWPAWPWLEDRERVLFLDIETTGLSRYYDTLTLVGYQVGCEHRVHVAGEDSSRLLSDLSAAACVVTYNGTLFDLPFLRDSFPNLRIECPHLDLRFAARRVGLVGGQKAIEQEIHSDVRKGLEDVDGRSAVLLWHRYLRGDVQALRELISYNLADVSGMRDILDVVCRRMRDDEQGCLFGWTSTFADMDPALAGSSHPAAPLPAPRRPARLTFEETFGPAVMGRPVVGIDLTGSEAKPSGFCVLDGAVARTAMLGTDDELVAATIESGARLVSMDSPLSLPRGRIRVTDDDLGRREFGIMRTCERTLKRRGINVYPCLLPSMQRLTARGIRLAARMRKAGLAVIESYPGAAQDIVGIPRKGAGEALLASGLSEFGLTGEFVETKVRHDELDAITSALVGYFFLAGRYEALGGEGENALIVPDMSAVPRRRLVVGISGRIASGKTTAARQLGAEGFAYARFSQVIDTVIRADGVEPTRATRQAYGWKLHVEKGQAWLLEKMLESLPTDGDIVVDGLRFPEDHANLAERFGGDFVHVRVDAPERLRAGRLNMDPASAEWSEIEAAPTEQQAERLAALADTAVRNDLDLARFAAQILGALSRQVGNKIAN